MRSIRTSRPRRCVLTSSARSPDFKKARAATIWSLHRERALLPEVQEFATGAGAVAAGAALGRTARVSVLALRNVAGRTESHRPGAEGGARRATGRAEKRAAAIAAGLTTHR